MQPADDIDSCDALIEVWRLVKPAEAKDLKTMVASADGRFAGIFTCDADQHGDRFFVLKENPRSGKWTLASNLISHLDDLAAANLGKSARQMVNEFRDIFANPSVRYEPTMDSHGLSENPSNRREKTGHQRQDSGNEAQPDASQRGPSAPPVPQPAPRLTGKRLLERSKELDGRRPEELARLCGYVIVTDGKEVGDTESYYSALFDAHSV